MNKEELSGFNKLLYMMDNLTPGEWLFLIVVFTVYFIIIMRTYRWMIRFKRESDDLQIALRHQRELMKRKPTHF